MRTFIVASLLAVLPACATRHFGEKGKIRSENSGAANSGASAAAMEAWKNLNSNAALLQPGCVPLHIAPPSGTETKGVVVMLHGFTACPQQFEVLGKEIAAAGYEVFAPPLVGHGRKPISLSPRKDDISFLPLTVGEFTGFTQKLADFMLMFPGKHMIVGNSLGGTYAVDLAVKLHGKADRVLLTVPMLDLNPLVKVGKVLFKTCDYLPKVCERTKEDKGIREFGEACAGIETDNGRNGYCQFMNDQANAMIAYGKSARTDLDAALATFKDTQFQFVIGKGDPVVDNGLTLQTQMTFERMGISSKLSAIEKPAAHSLFSQYDSPFEKPWLDSLAPKLVEFLVSGTQFDSLTY